MLLSILSAILCLCLIEGGPFRRDSEEFSNIKGNLWRYSEQTPLGDNGLSRISDVKPISEVKFINNRGENELWTFLPDLRGGFLVHSHLGNERDFIDQNILLKRSNILGFISADGVENGQAKYKVDGELYRSAGSISQLASNLGATPVGAVHTSKSRPYENTRPEEISPVLLHGEDQFYMLVPIQK